MIIFWSILILIKFTALTVLMSLISCGQIENNQQEKELSATKKVKELPESFVRSYEDFHMDSLQQLELIQFPLSGKAKNSNDTIWQQKNWRTHQPFNTASNLFERSFRVVGDRLIMEDILSPKLNLHMQRRWKEQEGRWLLIYYKELQAVK